MNRSEVTGIFWRRKLRYVTDSRKWLGRCVYSGIHEKHFSKFPILLNEWLSRLKFKKKIFQGGDLETWTLQLIQWLKCVNRKISRVIDFWFNIILEGYIIEFVFDTVKSYTEVEQEFFRGPRGRYLNSLKLWIEILLCEKWIMKMKFNE